MSDKIDRRQFAERVFQETVQVALSQIPVVGLGAGWLFKVFVIYREEKGKARLATDIQLMSLLDNDKRRGIIEAALLTSKGRMFTKNLTEEQLYYVRKDLLQLPSELQSLLNDAVFKEDSQRSEQNREKAEQASDNLRSGLREGRWGQAYQAARTLRRMGNEDPDLKNIEIMSYERSRKHVRVYIMGISYFVISALYIIAWAYAVKGPTYWFILPYIVVEFLLVRWAARSTTTGKARRYAYLTVFIFPIFTLLVLILIAATMTQAIAQLSLSVAGRASRREAREVFDFIKGQVPGIAADEIATGMRLMWFDTTGASKDVHAFVA